MKQKDRIFYSLLLALLCFSYTSPLEADEPGTEYVSAHTIYDSETWHSGGIYIIQGQITVAQG